MKTVAPEVLSSNSSARKISILMADDHPLFRKAVRNILEKQDDFVVAAEVDNGIEAVNLAVKLIPDIVIMDISMPQLNGLEATRQIKATCPKIAVLVLTVHNDIAHIMGILEAGAAGYLTKNVSEEEVISAIRSVIAGEIVMAIPVFHQVLRQTLRYPQKTLTFKGKERMTERELEVLRLAAKGLSNKDISLRLKLSLRTVKDYMMDIFNKLNVSSRTEAVIVGLRAGLITADDIE